MRDQTVAMDELDRLQCLRVLSSRWDSQGYGKHLLRISKKLYYIIIQNKEDSMAANQLVQSRIDGAIKEEASIVLAAMGLTVSDAVRLLLTKMPMITHSRLIPWCLMPPPSPP